LNNQKKWKIGELNARVISLLKLNLDECTIYIGDDNIEHMKSEHPKDYIKYGKNIKEILENPTYVSKHITKDDNSIHYIRVFKESNDYVKVIVRPTQKGKLFVRSVFVISEQNIYHYWLKNAFKTY